MKTEKNFEDIIDLPYPRPTARPRMSMKERAAQFSPFAALTGYDDVLKETKRTVERRRELDESELEQLDEQLRQIEAALAAGRTPKVWITWFEPDERKDGGRYVTKAGEVKKTDSFSKKIIYTDGTEIPAQEITDIEIEGETTDLR